MNSRVVPVFVYILIGVLCNSCFKTLPDKVIVYQNDFETSNISNTLVTNIFGAVDSVKIVDFNGSKVFGRFNSHLVEFTPDNMPAHNAVKIEFDLFIHDKWDGDYIPTGSTIPDIWKMTIDNYPVYVTTFSNGPYTQSFPNNYQGTISKNPPRSDAWGVLPGVCANTGKADGSSHYKIEYTTSHTGPLVLALSDVLQPFNSPCLKSWSIDNIRITAIVYK
jgi:hypothetical protein